MVRLRSTMIARALALTGLLLAWVLDAPAAGDSAPFSRVTARNGVLVHEDGREVALWGVNYEFNLSWEYRSYFEPLGIPLTIENLQQIADRDFEELAALDVQVVRVHLLPADFTDARGDLVETVFLHALDYLVAKCREKGMYVYLSLFNRMGGDYLKDSFAARRFGEGGRLDREKAPYIFDPELVDAYERYVRRLLDRRNPLTGTRYADEPAIAVWELMNEPEFPSLKDLDESGYEPVRAGWTTWRETHPGATEAAPFRDFRRERVTEFLNRFCAAVREAGAQQPVFWSYNWPGFIQQHGEVAEAVRASRIDGVSFCLYPGQNDLPHPIDYRNLPSLGAQNFLPMVQPDGVDWRELRRTRESGKAVVVYEFETWCNDTGYMYPAMARLFRELGAQIACMWEYDPAVAAGYNFVPSHFFNLRTSPAKAASFLIAGEVFRRYPRARTLPGEQLGATEFRFGPFGASYTTRNSWYIGEDTLMYAHNLPPESLGAEADQVRRPWRRIVGTGRSPAIGVSGDGLYRFEQVGRGYRLTLWPDTERRGDLWKTSRGRDRTPKIVVRTDAPRVVTLQLPGWAGQFLVRDAENGAPTVTARGGQFTVPPGVYLLEPDK